MFALDFEFLCALRGFSLRPLRSKAFLWREDQKILIAKCAKKNRKERKEIQNLLSPLTTVPLLNS